MSTKETQKRLLVTGGAGFIGSHTCLTLLKNGYNVIVLDNFSNSSPESLGRVQKLAELSLGNQLRIIEGDIRCQESLNRTFSHGIDAVIHFAGLKSIGESVDQPLKYWDVNVNGTLQLIKVMQDRQCRTLVFSSSATLYGVPDNVPIQETVPINPINPYGETKAAVETMLADLHESEAGWRIARLRYFNPVGAHPSGIIGENPNGTPNNLFPILSQVALGKRKALQIFGGDWPTHDGTGVRDYIHVMDLAEGHVETLRYLFLHHPQIATFNLGTGKGYSVMEVLRMYEEVSGRKIPFEIVQRRSGDAQASIADISKVSSHLQWRANRVLKDMCADAWRWQTLNPNGYQE